MRGKALGAAAATALLGGCATAPGATTPPIVWMLPAIGAIIVVGLAIGIIALISSLSSPPTAALRERDLKRLPWWKYRTSPQDAPLDVLCQMLRGQEPLLAVDAAMEISRRLALMTPDQFLGEEERVRGRLYRCLDDQDEELANAILSMIARTRDLTARRQVARFTARLQRRESTERLQQALRRCIEALAEAEQAPETTLLRASDGATESLLRPATGTRTEEPAELLRASQQVKD